MSRLCRGTPDCPARDYLARKAADARSRQMPHRTADPRESDCCASLVTVTTLNLAYPGIL